MNWSSKLVSLLAPLSIALETAKAGRYLLPLDQTNHWQFLTYRDIQWTTHSANHGSLEVGSPEIDFPASPTGHILARHG